MSKIDRTRAAYDTVAERYADAFADELDRRPLERGLLDTVVAAVGHDHPGSVIADVGCAGGHVTRYLAARGANVIGVDIAPRMIKEAHRRSPELRFQLGSFADLGADRGAWGGIVALYSIIHLTPEERLPAYRELARALRPGGWLLLSFHVSSAQFRPGDVNHLDRFLGEAVDLDGWFIDPEEVVQGLGRVGFEVRARVDREPLDDVEYPSRRCYLLARARSNHQL